MQGHTTVKQCPIPLKISMNAVLGTRLTNIKKFMSIDIPSLNIHEL